MNAQWDGTNPVYTNSSVGIGTGIPKNRLHIFSGHSGGLPYDNNGLTIENSNRVILQLLSNNSSDQYLMFGNTTAANRAWISYNHGTNEMHFTHYSTSGRYIYDNGNVGIGVNPMSKLHVSIGGSGAQAYQLNNTPLILESSGRTILQLLSPSTNDSYVMFGRPGFPNAGFIGYDQSSDALIFKSENKFIFDKGNIGIGTLTPDPSYKLDVCGTIRASEVKVDLQGTCVPDFVFKADFKLMDLNELETFVKTNQHLPEIAPEKELVENGVNMKEFQMKLLQKIEELTLYTIEQNKKIQALEEKIEKIESVSK